MNRRDWTRLFYLSIFIYITALKTQEVAGSIPKVVIAILYSLNPSGRSVAPAVDSASDINEYQEYLLLSGGVKAAGN